MSITYTSNSLIDSIKRRASVPQAQETFSPEDFLAFANEEINIGLVPSIMRLHQDYLLRTINVPLVANQSRYTIPDRAIGNKLRELCFVDTNGNLFEMTRINIEDLPDYNGPVQPSRYYYFYIENNEVVLVPGVQSSPNGSLNMSFYMRPNALVTEDRVAIITSINTITGEINVDSVPTAFTTSLLYDVIKSKSPFRTLDFDLAITAINPITNIITFNPVELPSTLAVGDYINIQEESIVPQVPSELHVVLAHRAASRCLEAMGDTQGLQNANAKLQEMEINTTTIISNRVEGAPQKVINRHGILRQGMFNRRYRFRI